MKTSFDKSVIVQVHHDKSNSPLVLYKKHRINNCCFINEILDFLYYEDHYYQ